MLPTARTQNRVAFIQLRVLINFEADSCDCCDRLGFRHARHGPLLVERCVLATGAAAQDESSQQKRRASDEGHDVHLKVADVSVSAQDLFAVKDSATVFFGSLMVVGPFRRHFGEELIPDRDYLSRFGVDDKVVRNSIAAAYGAFQSQRILRRFRQMQFDVERVQDHTRRSAHAFVANDAVKSSVSARPVQVVAQDGRHTALAIVAQLVHDIDACEEITRKAGAVVSNLKRGDDHHRVVVITACRLLNLPVVAKCWR